MRFFNNLIKRFKQGLYLRKEYIKVPNLPYSFVHISDLHYGSEDKFPLWLRSSLMNYFILNPTDILCVTGDLIDKAGDDPQKVLAFLYSLPVNYIVISLGNHDESAKSKIVDLCLHNSIYKQKLKLSINGHFSFHEINFICFPDFYCDYYNTNLLSSNFSKSQFNVVLSHNPNSFFDMIKECKRYPNTLMISGHTHGGQIFKADFLRKLFRKFMSKGKILNILKINHEHDCFQLQGSYILDNQMIHINTGLGTHPPMRLFCPPTLTIYK